MIKLDEIAELLTEEIHSFEKTVDRLEKLQSTLDNYKLEPDTTLVNQMLHEYHQSQNRRQDEIGTLIFDLKNKIEKSSMVPSWQIKLFWVWSFLNLLGWGITLVLLIRK